MENKEMKLCQSCGMPLSEDILGTNADGSKVEDYCIFCHKDGAFTGNFTMEEMADYCSQFVDEYNKHTGQDLSRLEYMRFLMKLYPTLKRWNTPTDHLPHADNPLKQQYIDEINALGIKHMPVITNLFVMQGSSINLTYNLNGNTIKLLDDNATYWCTQEVKEDASGRLIGVACNEKYIIVSEYDKGGANAETVAIKRR